MGRVLRYIYPRPSPAAVTPAGPEPSSVLNFQKEGNRLVSAGVFTLLKEEVAPVVEILDRDHIKATSLPEPGESGFYSLRYWALGKPDEVAGGLKAALDLIGKGSPVGKKILPGG